MRKLRYAAKVLGGTLSARGRSKIDLTIFKDRISGRIQLPGNISLGIDDIADVQRVELKRGWQSPKEIFKVVGITIASFFIGGQFIDEVDPEVASEVLHLAMTGENTGPLIEALEALADASTEVEEPVEEPLEFSDAVVFTLALTPAAYGGVVLSRRKVRFHLMTKDNRHVDIIAPEAAAAFIESLSIAKQHQNGNGEPPEAD